MDHIAAGTMLIWMICAAMMDHGDTQCGDMLGYRAVQELGSELISIASDTTEDYANARV